MKRTSASHIVRKRSSITALHAERESTPSRIDPREAERVIALERRIATTRPHPPDDVGDDVPETFVPDPAFAEWARETFINGGAPLESETHTHLMDATIGVLWTNVINIRQQRHVLATAEMPNAIGTWKRGRHDQQLREWFGIIPDFLLTFYAPEVQLLDDRGFCQLVCHELLHCAQAQDRFGAPRFNDETGQPMFAMRGHDCEVFFEEIELFGVTPDVAKLVELARHRPKFGDLVIANACGNCRAAA